MPETGCEIQAKQTTILEYLGETLGRTTNILSTIYDITSKIEGNFPVQETTGRPSPISIESYVYEIIENLKELSNKVERINKKL